MYMSAQYICNSLDGTFIEFRLLLEPLLHSIELHTIPVASYMDYMCSVQLSTSLCEFTFVVSSFRYRSSCSLIEQVKDNQYNYIRHKPFASMQGQLMPASNSMCRSRHTCILSQLFHITMKYLHTHIPRYVSVCLIFA